MEHVMETYSRLPITLVKGRGCRVQDEQGNDYLDMVAGIAVCNLGHAHPRVVEALKKQAEELFHCSNLYRIPQQETLARMISKNSFDSRVFFCNSGAEANEGAIKLVRRYCHDCSGRGQSSPVKRAGKRDDAGPPPGAVVTVTPHQLDGALVRLGT